MGEAIEIYKIDQLLELVDSNGIVKYSITIRGCHISELRHIKIIEGDLFLNDTIVESLGSLERIEGNFSISNIFNEPKLKSLGNLKHVTGDVYLSHSKVQSLGKLRSVGGNLNLRNTKICNLSSVQTIKGNLFLPKEQATNIDVSNIKIKGEVKYWNDGIKKKREFRSTYQLLTPSMPIPNWKFEYLINHNQVKNENKEIQSFYEYFKTSFLKGIYLDVRGETNYLFTLLLELRDTLDQNNEHEIIKQHFRTLSSCYPALRHYTTRWIIPITEAQNDYRYLKELILEDSNDYSIHLTQYFWILEKTDDYQYNSSILLKYITLSTLTAYGKANIEEVISIFSERILNIKCDDLGSFRSYVRKWKKFSSISITKPVEKEIGKVVCFFEKELRECENELRISRGLPKIGEGWITETELYYNIKKAFSEHKVHHHGKPKWIGKQHLDIYIEDLNIGIEYMGSQHYESVDYFGGDESLQKTQERDKQKKEKCLNNNCSLLIVNESYALDEIVDTIKLIRSTRKKSPTYMIFPAVK